MYVYVLQYVSIDTCTYTMYNITCILTTSEIIGSAPLHNSNITIE